MAVKCLKVWHNRLYYLVSCISGMLNVYYHIFDGGLDEVLNHDIFDIDCCHVITHDISVVRKDSLVLFECSYGWIDLVFM